MVGDILQARQKLTANRLMRLIRQMPEEEQFSVLRQLLGGDIASHIIELVSIMSYEKQLSLLQQFDETAQEERPAKTLLLDEEESFMRGYQRKSCLIAAGYDVGGKSYSGYILDISILGVFMETRMSFQAGQLMEISFKLPNSDEPLNISAEIVWNGRYGMGLKFKDLKREHEELIKKFIDNGEEGSGSQLF